MFNSIGNLIKNSKLEFCDKCKFPVTSSSHEYSCERLERALARRLTQTTQRSRDMTNKPTDKLRAAFEALAEEESYFELPDASGAAHKVVMLTDVLKLMDSSFQAGFAQALAMIDSDEMKKAIEKSISTSMHPLENNAHIQKAMEYREAAIKAIKDNLKG